MTEDEISDALNNLLLLGVTHDRIEALYSIHQTNAALAERLIRSRLIAARKTEPKHDETASQTQISEQISDEKSGRDQASSNTVCYVALDEISPQQRIASPNSEKSLVSPITNKPENLVDNSDESTVIMAEVAEVARPAANGQQRTTTELATTTSKTSTTTPAKPVTSTTPPTSSSVSTETETEADKTAKPISDTGHTDSGHTDSGHTEDADLLATLTATVLATLEGQRQNAAATTQPQPIPKPPARYPRLSAQSMADPRTLALCYSKALAIGHCTAADRYRFFVLAANIARRSELGDIQSPGGCFLSCVRQKRWFSSEADEDAATSILDSLGWRDSDA